MNYKVIAIEEFQKDVKKLYKRYKHIKNDILELIEKLEIDYAIGISLGKNIYKIRVRNSDTGGKKGGYRIIYYIVSPTNKIYLLTIYSKTDIENIKLEKLNPILERLEKIEESNNG